MSAGIQTELCYKCNGEGGSYENEGPHNVFMPCYRCCATGTLPLGELARELLSKCPECDGAGGEDCQNWEDPQPGGCWRNCRACGGTGRREAAAA